MPDDLYSALGIDRSASKAEVNRAWKRRVKKAHPDGGGSAEEFKRVQTAHMVLADDAKRARYDSTGEFAENAPDNAFANELQEVSQIIDIALGNLIRRGKSPEHSDMIVEMRYVITETRRKLNTEIEAFQKASNEWNKIVGRFSKKDGPNWIDQIVRGKITQIAMMVSTAEQAKERLAKVEAMLKDYAYRKDKAPEGGQRM